MRASFSHLNDLNDVLHKKTRISSCVYLLFQQHDSPAGLDGADFSVFVHGNHQQAVHHPLLPLTGVHQQVGAAGQTQRNDGKACVHHATTHQTSRATLEINHDGLFTLVGRKRSWCWWACDKCTEGWGLSLQDWTESATEGKQVQLRSHPQHEIGEQDLCTDSPLWFLPPQYWRLGDENDTAPWWRRCLQHPSGSRRGWACEHPPWSATPEQVDKWSAYDDDDDSSVGLCVCVSPFPLTPHTRTRCRCTWSSSGIAPAACWGWLTTQTVCKQRATTGDPSVMVTFTNEAPQRNNGLSLTCLLQKLVRPVVTAQCWKTRSLHLADSL